MEIAILGTGNVGRRLAAGWLRAGHTVTFGSRDPAAAATAWDEAYPPPAPPGTPPGRAAAAADRRPPRFATLEQAARGCETVVIAVPWPSVAGTLDRIGPLDGQVVIDCTNPLRSDLSGLDLEHHESAAEIIAERLPGAHVVKAFNTVGAGLLEDPKFGDAVAPVFFCGDDATAKGRVTVLIADLGFEPIDAGPLRVARYLEAFAMLFIHLAVFEGWREPFAFGILRRPSSPPPAAPSARADGGPPA